MRLLLASYYYWPSVGGTERHAHLLARLLVARGHHVRVVAAQLGGAAAREVVDGVEVTRVSAGEGSRWRKMGTYLTGAIGFTLLHGRKADVIQVQQAHFPAAALAPVARLLHRPLVVRNAASGSIGPLQRLRTMPLGDAALWLMARGATGVSLNAQMTGEMAAAGFRDLVTIPNGVEVPPPVTDQERREARRRLGLAGKVVLYAGRLQLEKGVDLLAEAWARAAPPDATLVMVGDGPAEAPLRAQLRGTRHLLHPAVADLRAHYAAADVFVLPSRSEGMSNALLEAMAHGLPVVATDVAGNREVLGDPRSGGRLVPRHPEALADALAEATRDPGCRHVGAQARTWVTERFSAATMVSRYEQLYARLIAARGGGARPRDPMVRS